MARERFEILSEYLVLSAQAGSRDAMSALVTLWTPRMRRRAQRLTRDDDAARETVQDAWLAIARGIRRLKDPARFGPWAARIVHHKAADHIARRVRERETLAAARASAPPPDHARSEPRDSDDGERVREAIALLDPKLRDVLILHHMDRCTLDQTARTLGIPVGTAKTRLKRARERLRTTLERSTP